MLASPTQSERSPSIVLATGVGPWAGAATPLPLWVSLEKKIRSAGSPSGTWAEAWPNGRDAARTARNSAKRVVLIGSPQVDSDGWLDIRRRALESWLEERARRNRRRNHVFDARGLGR